MYLFAKLIHQLVVLGALDGEFLQMRSVALDVHALSGLCKDGLLSVVRKHDDKCLRGIALGGVRESSSLHLNGVKSAHGSIGAVHVELTLIDVEQSAFELEVATVGAARCECQNSENKDI